MCHEFVVRNATIRNPNIRNAINENLGDVAHA